MKAIVRNRRSRFPVSHYWNLVKDMDNGQKLELVSMLIESVKPAVEETKKWSASSKPYTVEELFQMVAEGEEEFNKGQWQDSEDMFRELDEEFAHES
ncbi:MAG: hypothetical protein J5524_00210 [Bacteroidaceae bacterium]|nr:hypothetical protein [Bacteroidaceae bacterium]